MTPLAVLGVAALIALAVAIVVRQNVVKGRSGPASNRFASDIIDNAGEGIVAWDRDLRYVLWNRFMEEMTGLTASDVVGRPAGEVLPQLNDPEAEDALQRALRGETVSSPDVHYQVARTGRGGWISSVYRPHVDDDGAVVGVVGLIRDITARKSAEQQIEYQAYHDALTGLANRRLFHEHLALALALAQRRHALVSVLFLDLDHFKLVNDSLGHSIGDELLRQVARRLKSGVREGDTVARVGGDEFTIVLQELANRDAAAVVAQKVLQLVAEPMEVHGHRLYVTTSIGITFFPDDGDDAESLLKNADSAMYQAKAAGRNRYEMATEELNRSTQERMTMESGLRRAIERSEFELLYQPQIDIDSMTIVGMEALLRWNHPDGGVILPAHFIGLAEERGLILPLGDWVIREACRGVRKCHDWGLANFRVAVNLSPRQFRDPSLLSTIQSAVAGAGIDPRTLELEITEGVAMEDAELTMTTLSQLRAQGVTIAIDDFGTGHSSFSYLKRFPIDALKIDQTFVSDLPEKFEDAAIVSSVIQLANGLGLRVVAEGVEKIEQLDFLRESGCREAQGYLFSHPVHLQQIQALVRRGPVPVSPEAPVS